MVGLICHTFSLIWYSASLKCHFCLHLLRQLFDALWFYTVDNNSYPFLAYCGWVGYAKIVCSSITTCTVIRHYFNDYSFERFQIVSNYLVLPAFKSCTPWRSTQTQQVVLHFKNVLELQSTGVNVTVVTPVRKAQPSLRRFSRKLKNC
jgi:hypothetical protein